MAPLRSVARAGAWAAEHKKRGIVLENYGYSDMHHGCGPSGKQAPKDYDCVMKKLKGENVNCRPAAAGQ